MEIQTIKTELFHALLLSSIEVSFQTHNQVYLFYASNMQNRDLIMVNIVLGQ